MSDGRGFGDAFLGAANTLVERLGAYFPSIVAATLLLLAGWVLARLMRALAARGILLIDTLLPRLGLPAGASRIRAGRSSAVVGAVVFWAVLLVFATAAVQVLGLHAFTDWLGRLVQYLPTLALGLLIIAAGWVVSGFAADLVQAAALRLEPGQRRMLARIVRISILVGAILIGADQIGIRITFLAIFVGAIALTVGGGVAIAVGFGAREHVASLIAAQHARLAYGVGQSLRIGEHEGRLLEVTATSVILETPDGRVVIPARRLNELAVTVRSGADRG